MAQELVGKTLFVDWPYLVEAKVCAVSDGREKYFHASSVINGLMFTLSHCMHMQYMHIHTVHACKYEMYCLCIA